MSEREFSACWFRVRAPLYRHAMEHLRSDSYLADDALGRLLIVLCRQREKMPAEVPSGFNFYAHSRKMLQYAICRTLTTQNRQKRKGITVSLHEVTEDGGALENPAVIRQQVQKQREAAYRAELSARASQALRAVELPEQWAQCYVLKSRGETFEDIARELKVTKERAYQMYQQVVKRLQKMHVRLEAEGKDDGSLWTGAQLHAWGSAVSIA